MTEPIQIGAVFEVPHPFILDDYEGLDEDGPFKTKSWRPGTRPEMCGPEDCEMVADAMGVQIVTVVSTHKPGRFPERVFYTRRWRAPTGREFGQGKLHTKTSQAFRRLIKGYRHPFQLLDRAAA